MELSFTIIISNILIFGFVLRDFILIQQNFNKCSTSFQRLFFCVFVSCFWSSVIIFFIAFWYLSICDAMGIFQFDNIFKGICNTCSLSDEAQMYSLVLTR